MTPRNALRAAVVASMALVAFGASAFEYHGYFRETAAVNSKGGGQVCFQLPGSDFKARLGNECDHYMEVSLSDKGTFQNIEWKYEFMPNYFQPNTDSAAYDNRVGLAQSWAGLKFNDWGGATLWAGQRYFRRHDVHSLDWFYWNPGQGNAAVGVEDVNTGFGKLAITAFRMDATIAPTPPATAAKGDLTRGVYIVPEVRLYDIPLYKNATLELGVDLALANDQKVAGVDALGPDRAGSSPLFTIQHNQSGFLGGSNTLAFQYGSGAFANESGGGKGQLLAGGTKDDKQWRIIEHLVFNPVSEFSGALVLVYQDKSTAGTTNNGLKIFTAELRPAYHVNDWFKLAADVFYQSIDVKNAAPGTGTPTLTKLTVAPTFALGRGYYSRPELRFFVTYASWNDAAGVGGIANGAFGTAKSGTTYGAQLETWF
jgi:maltoporin